MSHNGADRRIHGTAVCNWWPWIGPDGGDDDSGGATTALGRTILSEPAVDPRRSVPHEVRSPQSRGSALPAGSTLCAVDLCHWGFRCIMRARLTHSESLLHRERTVMASNIDHSATKAPEVLEGAAKQGMVSRRNILLGGTTIVAAAALQTVSEIKPAQAQATGKPNILVIWGDDIGYW